MANNPFEVSTPENMPAEQTVNLFVDVFSDFPKLLSPGHTFLNGPRGSGKSMMFRFLMPDCQILHSRKTFKDLGFSSFYIPLKNFNFITELQRLKDNHGEDVINSSLLTLHCAVKIFQQLEDIQKEHNVFSIEQIVDYYNSSFIPRVDNITWGNCPIEQKSTKDNASSILDEMKKCCEILYSQVTGYLKRYAINSKSLDYNGPICDYLDFLFPLLKDFRHIDGMPNGPIFLLIDDADNLSPVMTRVLNSWVLTRTSSDVSLKISTQLGYKTYYTSIGNIIETPHDYYEINISTVYTTNQNKYKERLRSIVERRLKKEAINVSPERFFPENKKQSKAIKLIAEEIKENFDEKGRGYSVYDDIQRYARPEYITRLGGTAKSSHTYSYAGFEQLTHISSGIIRFFLTSAYNMYNEVIAKDKEKKVTCIPPAIQNSVIRRDADEFLYDNLEKEIKDVSSYSISKEQGDKLSNLLHALGGLFRECLISKRSERRVFSIAISDKVSLEVEEVLELGVKLGYLHKALIGKKTKNEGRTRLYILSRRLAPVWTLDPSGFAGYLFIKNEDINEALYKPSKLLNRISKNGIDNELESAQLVFDFD